MVKEAEMHADEDKKTKEKAEVKNEADNFIYTTEKALKDYGDKVPDDDRQKINAAIADLRKSMEGENIPEIKQKIETLKQASYKLAEEMYKASSSQQTQGGGGTSTGTQDTSQDTSTDQGPGKTSTSDKGNVEDVDYEVVDDDDSDK
jgi:molecular chaperone DnaK